MKSRNYKLFINLMLNWRHETLRNDNLIDFNYMVKDRRKIVFSLTYGLKLHLKEEFYIKNFLSFIV